jgi:phenylalanyl-tRNA synthetase alpha chain
MSSDVTSDIESALAALGERFRTAFAAAKNEAELRAEKARVLGKKGDLTAVLRRLGEAPPADRKAIGERVNGVKDDVERTFDERLRAIHAAIREADLHARPYDLSLPGRKPGPRGHLHPLTQVKNEVLDIFQSLGFVVAGGPEVELESNNFTKLAFPPDHPAMDMQDSFWVTVKGATPARTLLRTHTSNVQVREMSSRKPPMAVVSGGVVYRRGDDDSTHSPMFHQVEGFLVNEHVTFAELKGVLTAFAERLYGYAVGVRFRPSYFPFVEPGAEVDLECAFCTERTKKSCRVCKGTRWLEVLGSGMVHPDVFTHCGIDPEKYTGFAFGLGVERIAMIRYGIPDIRLLFENDPRFLAMF